MVRELSADGTKAIGNPVIVFDGNKNGNYVSEGPKFYKRNGYYYIMWPAGGVVDGWQMAARSKNVYGPYEYRKVMDKGNSGINGPHQGGWVETAQGEHWFLNFQDKDAYGRVVHLNPMKWVDDWPVIGIDKDGDGCGEPVAKYKKPKSNYSTVVNPQESDEFNNPALGKQWQWHANYDEEYHVPLGRYPIVFKAYASTRSPLEIFSELYEKQNGEKPNAEQQALLTKLIESIWEEEA